MRNDNLLDMENRIGKAPGAYCTDLTSQRQPFIFMNAIGIHEDVQTLLHEAGHAFHVFATARLPYIQQTFSDMEFAEVASMAMELLSAPYLTVDDGGFYTPEQAARARIEHLESSILFWPYMAVVDLFQHWVYENTLLARDPSNCDRVWGELWDRYMPGVDWSGFEEVKETGWQRKLHIHQMPFYYIEYGLAQLGALQVFGRSLQDQAAAVEGYRVALSLGGTVPLPDLFTAAGAEFALDAHTLGRVCSIAVNTINQLETLNTRQ
jgi:oligoendopeptidase F